MSAQIETSVAVLELSPRARSALARSGVATVGDLLDLRISTLAELRNVGTKTLRELTELRALMRGRTVNGDLASSSAEAERQGASINLDRLLEEVMSLRGSRNQSEVETVQRLLGLYNGTAPPNGVWPSQSSVADDLGVSRARLGQVALRARLLWLLRPQLAVLRDEIEGILRGRGGVLPAAELVDAVLASNDLQDLPEDRRRQATAVVRAAVEAEKAAEESRFRTYRRPRGAFVALTGDGALGARLATYANASLE